MTQFWGIGACSFFYDIQILLIEFPYGFPKELICGLWIERFISFSSQAQSGAIRRRVIAGPSRIREVGQTYKWQNQPTDLMERRVKQLTVSLWEYLPEDFGQIKKKKLGSFGKASGGVGRSGGKQRVGVWN